MSENIEGVPLLVDLDGSLVRTDTLFETAILFIKGQPWLLPLMALWLLQGKTTLKRELAERTKLNVEVLPYRTEVIDYLENERTNGREIILCTGSWSEVANRVAAHLNIFSGVMASDASQNLTGKNKARTAVERFGERGFDYLGNEDKDLLVWKHSRRALVVGDEKLEKKAAAVTDVEKNFKDEKAGFKVFLKAIRVHQWAKNALLVVPLLTAHQLANVGMISDVIVAFISFGLCASATYLLNDMFDLEADRKHRTKCRRPLAAGTISIPAGVLMFTGLMAAGLGLAVCLNLLFVIALLVYLFLTIIYSFKLKRLQTVDVIVLASLFTIRVIAGGAAISVPLSFWLLCFSMFLFLSLAIVKRVSELIKTAEEVNASEKSGEEKVSGRGYYISDLVILQNLGGCSAFMSVLVLAFYINSDEVVQLYRHPEILWLICPIIGYWVMRVWMLTARGQMNEDPISFAIVDKNSWYAGGLVLMVLFVAGLI